MHTVCEIKLERFARANNEIFKHGKGISWERTTFFAVILHGFTPTPSSVILQEGYTCYTERRNSKRETTKAL
jgi:hypothetical protein